MKRFTISLLCGLFVLSGILLSFGKPEITTSISGYNTISAATVPAFPTMKIAATPVDVSLTQPSVSKTPDTVYIRDTEKAPDPAIRGKTKTIVKYKYITKPIARDTIVKDRPVLCIYKDTNDSIVSFRVPLNDPKH